MEHLELAVSIATLISVIVALGAVVQAGRHFKKGRHTAIFLEYTRRYDEILMALPLGARTARFDLEGDPPPESEDLSLAVLRYLNLCAEEFYLVQDGYLGSRIWLMWEDELRRTLGTFLMKREFAKLRHEFQSYPEFLRFVDEIQSSS